MTSPKIIFPASWNNYCMNGPLGMLAHGPFTQCPYAKQKVYPYYSGCNTTNGLDQINAVWLAEPTTVPYDSAALLTSTADYYALIIDDEQPAVSCECLGYDHCEMAPGRYPSGTTNVPVNDFSGFDDETSFTIELTFWGYGAEDSQGGVTCASSKCPTLSHIIINAFQPKSTYPDSSIFDHLITAAPTAAPTAPVVIADCPPTFQLNPNTLVCECPSGFTQESAICQLQPTCIQGNCVCPEHYTLFGGDTKVCVPVVVTPAPTSSPISSPTSPPTPSPTPSPTLFIRTAKIYHPPALDGEQERPIEGIAVADFPPDFTPYFWAQNVVFTMLYAFLSLRILVQLLITDGFSSLCTVNRHHIATFVLLGAAVRCVYIVTTDIYSTLHPTYAYVLRGLNDGFWFAAFAFLAFFWYELRARPLKKGVKAVDEFRPHLYLTVLLFSLLRAARIACEVYDLKSANYIAKALVYAYLLFFFLFCQAQGSKLLGRLKEIAAKSRSNDGKTSLAMQKFTLFLVAEAILCLVLVAEHVIGTILCETQAISLGRTPRVVFFLKIVSRGTEFLLMAMLVYLVCLKTASKNLTKNKVPWMVPKINLGRRPSETLLNEKQRTKSRTENSGGLNNRKNSVFGCEWGDDDSEHPESDETFVAFDGRAATMERDLDRKDTVIEMTELANPLELEREQARAEKKRVEESEQAMAEKKKVEEKRVVKKEEYTKEVVSNTNITMIHREEKRKKSFGIFKAAKPAEGGKVGRASVRTSATKVTMKDRGGARKPAPLETIQSERRVSVRTGDWAPASHQAAL